MSAAPDREPDPPTDAFWRWVAAAATASVALRLRFIAAPLTVDESGALTVARSWAHGRRLYTDVFIDRPQGVVALFQRWDALMGGHPAGIRVLAMVAGIAAVVGVAVAARAVSGSWRAGAAAAWLAAVISSSAAFEGYAANGELLAGGFAVPALAIGALVITRRLAPSWLVLAGALSATGMTMKQSGFDVPVAIGAWLVLAAVLGWRPWRQVVAPLAWLGLGAAAVLGAVAVHGASLGWDAYVYALYGFRLHARSALAGAQTRRMLITMGIAAPLLLPTVIIAARRLHGTQPRALRRMRPEHVLVVLWLAAAGAAFAVGGNFHRHYWIELTFPFAALFGILLAAATDPARVEPIADLRRSLTWALALPLAISLVLIAAPRIERDRRIDADEALADWYHARSATEGAGNGLLPLCASATYYLDAGELPRYRYLWVDHVQSGRGAIGDLVRLLDGPDRPSFLAMQQPASRCDRSGRLQAAIDRNYRPAATVVGVPVLAART
ncbi:hypothetical protein [Aquihabitans sp. McL0605]|uniref:hypothetical protein n=1 Tax=Aquihabitans sp. McL0605 TaxID=3415671 RepID=UPI003CE95C6C